MSDGKKLTETVTTRFPKVVMDAIKKRVADKQEEYPRFNEADLIRISAVEYLKQKGYLDKKKNYL